MLHYQLRTLLIILAIGPLVLAWLVTLVAKLPNNEVRGLYKLNVTAAKSDYPEVESWIQTDTSDSP